MPAPPSDTGSPGLSGMAGPDPAAVAFTQMTLEQRLELLKGLLNLHVRWVRS